MTTSSWFQDQEVGRRGSHVCRGCGCGSLVSILDLGSQPLANRLLRKEGDPDPSFPLDLKICSDCLLGQVGEVVRPEAIFTEYPYLSSISTSWIRHCREFAAEQNQRLLKRSADSRFVLEIASNDGHLLQEFKKFGFKVLGVEPASNVADIARQNGIPTVSEFFGTDIASQIVSEYGYPDLVVANNVLAHVPDLIDFARGLSTVCGPDTLISVENPSFLTLLVENQFDTIYHEHYSYLSVHAVRRLAERAALHLFDVQYMPSHGGSYRYWLERPKTSDQSPIVEKMERNELQAGLGDQSVWKTFEDGARKVISDCQSWLLETQQPIAAYGAAAKGNTLLNAVGTATAQLTGVFDGSPEKVGKYLPGSHLAIWDRCFLKPNAWEHILILPWNIRDEIAHFIWSIDPKIRLWTAIPSVKEIKQQ